MLIVLKDSKCLLLLKVSSFINTYTLVLRDTKKRRDEVIKLLSTRKYWICDLGFLPVFSSPSLNSFCFEVWSS